MPQVWPWPHTHLVLARQGFGGDEDLLNQVWAGLVVRLGRTPPFLAVGWWLEHEQLRRPAVTTWREPDLPAPRTREATGWTR